MRLSCLLHNKAALEGKAPIREHPPGPRLGMFLFHPVGLSAIQCDSGRRRLRVTWRWTGAMVGPATYHNIYEHRIHEESAVQSCSCRSAKPARNCVCFQSPLFTSQQSEVRKKAKSDDRAALRTQATISGALIGPSVLGPSGLYDWVCGDQGHFPISPVR